MSAVLTKSQIIDHQRILACSGLYKGGIDGSWGSKTNDADKQFTERARSIRAALGEYDSRSETTIATLILPAQAKARAFLSAAKKSFAHEVKLISGTRSESEQNALYAQGRTAPGHVVTNASGGHSNHNFGIAWDCGIFDGGHYYDGMGSDARMEEQAYIDLAKIIKASVLGLEWGGDWKTIIDRPHYQLATGKTLTQIRTAFEAGSVFA